jgi:hypothetical protein
VNDGDAPLVPGPLYGLRTWKVAGGRLAGPFAGTTWPTESVMTATCSQRRHAAPQPGCGCGLYALHPTTETAQGVLAVTQGGGRTVAGIIAAWGPVQVHADGFRAQSARVQVLVIPRGAKRKNAERIRRLAASYGADVLEAGPSELLRHCRDNGLGLDESAIAELVDGAAKDERRRTRRARIVSRLRVAGATVGALALLVGVVKVWPVVTGWISGPAARIPPESSRLAILEHHLLESSDGDTVLIAVVRNDHPTRAALGVFVAGTLRGGDNDVLARLDSRLETETRPVLAPGDSGVVVNVLDDPVAPSVVARYRLVPMARAFRRGVPRPPVRLRKVHMDPNRCLVTAEVTSDRNRLLASTIILAYDRRGRLQWGDQAPVGPLLKGRSAQVVQRADPRRCATPPARMSAYAYLTQAQVIRRETRP